MLKINIDVAAIAKQCKEFAMEVEQDLRKGVAALASMTHAKVGEMAEHNLHSSLKQFQDNMKYEEVAPGVFVITVLDKAMWIEEGIKPDTDMKPGLLRNATKTSKAGYKYRSVPFEHSKAPSQTTPYAQSLVSQIKQVLKERKIPFKKIEKDANGNPRLGRLHSLNIPSKPPTSRASTPALQGLNIYQSTGKSGNVRRDIMTFRTVSESPASNGKWMHPGYEAQRFLDKAMEWALNEWESRLLPDILSKWQG